MQKKISTADSTLPSAEKILALLTRQNKPLKLDALARAANTKDKKALATLLTTMAESGQIARLPGGLWLPLKDIKTTTGQYRQLSTGNGLVICEDGAEVPIKAANAGNAWDKDQVKIWLLPNKEDGKVVEVLKRAEKAVPARITKREGKILLCKANGKSLPIKFHARFDSVKSSSKKLTPGTLVTVKPEKKLAPDLWQATVLNVYPEEDTVQAQESIVKAAHGVPGAFPELAVVQADALPKEPDAEDFAHREDLRHLPFVTIDGADARDFDDAIQVERMPDGWILRVAIADVSHYVQPDPNPDSLDGEALKRGNSWYFPRSVEPMLPESLSNGLCSLMPDVNRLAMLAEIIIAKDGTPVSARFAPAVIRSHARLTYDQAADFFANPESSAITDPAIKNMLSDARELYKALAKMRHDRGTLDFELPEPAYQFDEKGRLENIKTAERNDAHRLIEEFMIAANEAVARHLGNANLPFPYRVHPKPEQAKLKGLFETLRLSAAEILPPGITEENLGEPATIQKILEAARDTPSEYVVNQLCLRAMSQAKYQPEHQEHFGLASSDYCHFTSPIRRYADLLTHRALKASLGLSEKAILKDDEELDQITEQLNKLEREALECERDMARRLGCFALKDKIGQTMQGVISGVTEFGLFVEFKTMPSEGLIRISELNNDWYEFDKQKQMLIGKNTGQTWRLGQPVEVKILNVDLDRFETRLAPAQLPQTNPAGKPKKKGSSFEKSGKRTAGIKNGSRALTRKKSKFA